MNIFGDYAQYYDLLYQDKDYAGEAQSIDKILQTYAPNATQVLELGCGTGAHAVLLAKQGYQVHGIDLSTEMLQQTHHHICQLDPDSLSRLKFTQGDIRQIRLDRQFDVVLALFHVISYQVTNEDLCAVFATVKEHLQAGGIFIFDVWYGPAVLTDRPTVRIKQLQNESIAVTRIAAPIIYPNENCVDINYQVFIKIKKTSTVEELNETHRMRYLFKPEIQSLLQEFDMNLIDYREWISDLEAGFDTWSVYFVAKIGR